jgi:hypothetical protein
MDDELLTFVKDALARGRSRSEIAEVLQRAGWSREQLTGALDAYADVEFAVPVPMPRPDLSARDAFVYLVLFTALYVTAYHLGSLVFDLINLALPDRAMDSANTHYIQSGMRWAVASLIVAFPVFAFMTRLVGREVARDPGKRRSKVRRWLTYLTLFIAACVLIADVTTLVYNALGGELTIRFVLKVVTVAVIAGGVFGYYLQDLRVDETDRPRCRAAHRHGSGAGGRRGRGHRRSRRVWIARRAAESPFRRASRRRSPADLARHRLPLEEASAAATVARGSVA